MRGEDATETIVSAPADPLAALRDIALLQHATDSDLEGVVDRVDWIRVDAGEEVFAQGDVADGMYFVARGRLECVADGEVLREVARGESIGELALLLDDRRTATVRAVRDSLLVRLEADDLPALLDASPATALEIARLVARRAATGPVGAGGAGLRSVALVSLDHGHDVAPLADEVERRIAATARTSRVDAGALRDVAGTGGLDAVVRMLALEEDHNDTVVVTCPDLTSGDGETRRLITTVLRQMDLVVVVVRAGAAPERSALSVVAASRRPVTVAMVHTQRSTPAGTGRLLATIDAVAEVKDHVHLRDGRDDDLGRLARILSGHAVGLVLGGGGSRGFTHMGVVRALREAGIPIDRVGGSSMGAVMGAQVAAGWSPAEMIERNREVWSRRRLAEIGLPTLSLLRGRRAVHMFRELFGDLRVEDLWLDYFCTTVNLSSFRLHIAREGRVADWVRASATVPGLWPPLVDDEGQLHADGGVLDNVPTDIMRTANVGSVIGVDVCNRQSPMLVTGSADLPGGLGLLLERRRRWVPTILDVLNRSNLLASLQTHEHADRHADLFLAPPVEDEGFAAFDKIADLADLGYRFTVDALEQADLSSLSAAMATEQR